MVTENRDKWGWESGGVRVLPTPEQVAELDDEATDGQMGAAVPPQLASATRAWFASLVIFVAQGHSPDEFAMDPDLADYWLHGEGAAKIRWCTKGSFRRAQNALREHIPPGQLDGAVANLYRRACGKNPGPHND